MIPIRIKTENSAQQAAIVKEATKISMLTCMGSQRPTEFYTSSITSVTFPCS